MKKIAMVVSTILALVIVFALVTTTVWMFWETLASFDNVLSQSLLGAFAGAFFAFLFLRLGESLRRIFERQEKHHNAIIRLQHYLNDCLSITADNIFVIDNFSDAFSDNNIASGELHIFWNQTRPYPVDRTTLIGLTNIDFINDVFTLNVELQKLNDSMASLDGAYNQIAIAFIQNNIDQEAYISNVVSLRHRYCNEIKPFLFKIKDELIKVFATSRLLSKNAPWFVHVIRFLTSSRYGNRLRRELPSEIKKIEDDIQKSSEESRQRIQQTLAQSSKAK